MIVAKLAVTLTALMSVAASRLWTIPSWFNTTIIELVWLLIGVAIILVSSALLPRLVTDYNLVAKMPPDIRDAAHVLAHAHIRREVIRLLQGVIMTSIGVYACATPPLVPGPQIVTTAVLVLTAGLIALTALTILQSVLDAKQRYDAENILMLTLVEEVSRSGTEGPAGPAGPAGPRGREGRTGPQGDEGDTGDVGNTGATGPRVRK